MPDTPVETNPFTKLYDAVVKECKACNFIVVDWNSSTDPEPEIPTEHQLPEFQVMLAGLSGVLGNRSCGTDITRTFQILINSGDQRVGVLLEREWRLLGLLHRLKFGTLDQLTYKGRTFVDTVIVNAATQGLSNADQNRGIKGWTALWSVSVNMLFPSADLPTN